MREVNTVTFWALARVAEASRFPTAATLVRQGHLEVASNWPSSENKWKTEPRAPVMGSGRWIMDKKHRLSRSIRESARPRGHQRSDWTHSPFTGEQSDWLRVPIAVITRLPLWTVEGTASFSVNWLFTQEQMPPGPLDGSASPKPLCVVCLEARGVAQPPGVKVSTQT